MQQVNMEVLHFFHSSDVTFDGNSSVRYVDNRAATGGAMHCTNYTNLIIGGNANLDFLSNVAKHGGAIGIQHSNVTLTALSSTKYK